LSVVLFVVLKLEKPFAKEDEDKEDKEDNIEDEMKNMPEKKKAICETVQCLSSLFLMLLLKAVIMKS
jgi:hypothetical protein